MTTDPDRRVPVARGDEFELAIDGLGDGPDGIGHVGNYVVFVPGVLPGERALVRITSASRKYGRAELLELRSHAAARVTPACPHFLDCGGCHRQHQDYRAQLLDKQARLQRAVTFGLGEDAIEVDETRGMRPRTAIATRSSCTCATRATTASSRASTGCAAPSSSR
jgi:23S rRNA (uracil1939-C5)-methyltransferase